MWICTGVKEKEKEKGKNNNYPVQNEQEGGSCCLAVLASACCPCMLILIHKQKEPLAQGVRGRVSPTNCYYKGNLLH
jgi:hypothetical protein